LARSLDVEYVKRELKRRKIEKNTQVGSSDSATIEVDCLQQNKTAAPLNNAQTPVAMAHGSHR
jgi:hypothetical protein